MAVCVGCLHQREAQLIYDLQVTLHLQDNTPKDKNRAGFLLLCLLSERAVSCRAPLIPPGDSAADVQAYAHAGHMLAAIPEAAAARWQTC
jgi:hypothetical protein